MTSEESFINNYGAALQGFALFYTIKRLGYYPKIVRYYGNMQPPLSSYSFPIAVKHALGRVYHSIIDFFSETELDYFEKKAYKKENANRRKLFRDFQIDLMKFYNSKRIGWYDLKKNPPLADYYICGSDQIWNPFFRSQKNDLGYFLDFAPLNKPRIAYAPSFGCDELPETAKRNIKELIEKFRAVSVREKAGQQIIKKETGRDVPVVADPTLLLTSDEWASFEQKVNNIPDKYILCYRFSDNRKTKEHIDDISRITGLPVLTLPLALPAYRDNYQKVFQAGPREFIYLIHNASLVCTDSFHATVFSLIFHTPFYCFLRENFKGNSSNMNSRINNLLSISRQENRCICDEDTINKDSMFDVDFSAFDQEIIKLRNFSVNWLKQAFE